MIAVRSTSAAPAGWSPCRTQTPNLTLRGKNTGLKVWARQTPWLMELQCGDRVLFAQAFLAQASPDLIVHLWESGQGRQNNRLGQASFRAWKDCVRVPAFFAISNSSTCDFALEFRFPIEGIPESIRFNAE